MIIKLRVVLKHFFQPFLFGKQNKAFKADYLVKLSVVSVRTAYYYNRKRAYRTAYRAKQQLRHKIHNPMRHKQCIQQAERRAPQGNQKRKQSLFLFAYFQLVPPYRLARAENYQRGNNGKEGRNQNIFYRNLYKPQRKRSNAQKQSAKRGKQYRNRHALACEKPPRAGVYHRGHPFARFVKSVGKLRGRNRFSPCKQALEHYSFIVRTAAWQIAHYAYKSGAVVFVKADF